MVLHRAGEAKHNKNRIVTVKTRSQIRFRIAILTKNHISKIAIIKLIEFQVVDGFYAGFSDLTEELIQTCDCA